MDVGPLYGPTRVQLSVILQAPLGRVASNGTRYSGPPRNTTSQRTYFPECLLLITCGAYQYCSIWWPDREAPLIVVLYVAAAQWIIYLLRRALCGSLVVYLPYVQLDSCLCQLLGSWCE